MRLMIHTVLPGDVLTMVGPDGATSEPFTLAEPPSLQADTIWLFRECDVPIVVGRTYGLQSSFRLHVRRAGDGVVGRHRTTS